MRGIFNHKTLVLTMVWSRLDDKVLSKPVKDRIRDGYMCVTKPKVLRHRITPQLFECSQALAGDILQNTIFEMRYKFKYANLCHDKS